MQQLVLLSETESSVLLSKILTCEVTEYELISSNKGILTVHSCVTRIYIGISHDGMGKALIVNESSN